MDSKAIARFPSITELGPARAFGAAIPNTGVLTMAAGGTNGLADGDTVIIMGEGTDACGAEGTFHITNIAGNDVTVKPTTTAEATQAKCRLYKSIKNGADQIVIQSVNGQTCASDVGKRFTITGKNRAGSLKTTKDALLSSITTNVDTLTAGTWAIAAGDVTEAAGTATSFGGLTMSADAALSIVSTGTAVTSITVTAGGAVFKPGMTLTIAGSALDGETDPIVITLQEDDIELVDNALYVAEVISAQTTGAATKCLVTSGTTGGTGASRGSVLTYQFELSEPSSPPGGFAVADAVTTATGATAYVTTAAITATITGSGTPCTDTLVNTGAACDGTITVGGTNIAQFAVGDVITLGQATATCTQAGQSFTVRAIGATNGIIYIHEKIAAETSGKCNVVVETCPQKVFTGSDKLYSMQCNGMTSFDIISGQVAASSFQDDARNSAAASLPASLVMSSDITAPTVTILALGEGAAVAATLVDGAAGSAVVELSQANRKKFRVGDEIVFDSSSGSNCAFDVNTAVGSNAAVTPALRTTVFKVIAIDTTNHRLTVDLQINVGAGSTVADCTVRRVLPSGTPYNGKVVWQFTLSEAVMESGDYLNQFVVADVKYGADGTAASTTCDDSAPTFTTATGTERLMSECDMTASGSDADLVVSVPAGAFTDKAGNANIATKKYVIRLDATVPTSTVDAFTLAKYNAGTMTDNDKLASGSSTASSQVVFRVTADKGVTYTTGTSALASVYGVCASTDSCGNALDDVTGLALDTSGTAQNAGLTVSNCENEKFGGSKGVYYVYCDFADGTTPSVAVPAGAFTDATRNENALVSAVTVTFT
jgi:hypothetical protein